MRNMWLKLGFVAILISQVACTVKVDSPNINGHLNVDGNAVLKCTADLPDILNGIIDSGVSFPIKVTATGGAGQYKINATGESFGAEITIVKTYTNSGVNNEIKTDTIQVKDSSGIIAECSFTVTVKPDTDPSDLACSIATGVASPHISQNVPLVVTASGGAGAYSFTELSLGDSGSVLGTPLSTQTQHFATAKYSTAGSKTISIKLSDSTDSVTCSKSLTVRPDLAVSAVPTPSANVQADGTITLTASSDGFASAPTYTFSSANTGALIVANGKVATITSFNQQARNFNVLVTAEQGGESKSVSIPLSFTALPPLTCELKHPAGSYKVDDSIVFTVTAGTNESVEIVSFYAGAAGSVTASTNSSRTVKFSAAGSKVPWAIAKVKRGTSDVYCNYGDYLFDTITIANKTAELACDVKTNPSWSYAYEYINIEVTTPYGKSGSGGVYVTSLKANGSDIPWWDGYYFSTVGTKAIEVKVKDSVGTEATCNTNHIVYDYNWWY